MTKTRQPRTWQRPDNLLLLLFLLTSSCPSYEVRRLMTCSQFWRSSASSLVALILQRSCSTQFIHVFFGLPGGLLPSTSILNTLPNASVFPLLATWPYHLNLRTLITFRTSVSPHLCNSSLLGTLSRSVTPAICLIILLSQLLIVDSRLCISGHVSEAYSSTDHMQASYTAALFLRGIYISCPTVLLSLSTSPRPLLLSFTLCFLLLPRRWTYHQGN